MSSPDPYRPPTAPVLAEEKSPLGPERYFVVGIVVLQILFSLRYTGVVLELTRTGATTVLFLLGTMLSIVLLAAGAFLLISGARAARYVLAFAALVSCLLLLQNWRPVFALTCPVVALVACIYAVWAFRRSARADAVNVSDRRG